MAELWVKLGRILIFWTLATTLGGVMAYGIFIGLEPVSLGNEAIDFGIRVLAAGIFAGTLTGRLQIWSSIGLWERPRWVWATGLGWLIGIPLIVSITIWLGPLLADSPDGLRLSVILSAAGAIGGIASIWQWQIIKKHLPRSEWWLLANGVGWMMAWLVVLAVGLFLGSGEPLPRGMERLGHGLVLGGAAGFIVGFEQGIALIGLIAQQAWDKKG